MAAFFDKFRNQFFKSDDQRERELNLKRQRELEKAIRDDREAQRGLIDEIRELESRAKLLGKELEKTTGQSKRILISQIEQTFCDLDLLKEREKLIQGNISSNTLVLEKIKGLVVASGLHGATAETMDDVGTSARLKFDELRDRDTAARQLERDTYEPPPIVVQAPDDSLEQRAAHIKAVQASEPTLSTDAAARLKELNGEEA